MTTAVEVRWALAPDALFDGERLRRAHAVVVEGERVVGVEAVGALPDGMEARQLPGCTLLPGLIDCHTHISDWMLPAFLAAGVTAIRDTGNDPVWILDRRERTRADPMAGPDILCCGPLLDGDSAFWPQIGRSHPDAAAIRRSVDEMAERGADAVKLYVHLTTEQIGAAATQADRRGLPLLAHLGPSVDLATAVSAGVREVQHLTGCVHHVEGWRTNVDEVAASAASLATAGVAQCPTLVVWDRLCRLNDTAFRHDRRDRWVHPDIAAVWQRFPHRTGEVTDRLDRQRSVNTMKRVLGALAGAGCTVVAGSDAPFPHLVPGFSLHDELSLLVDAGLEPAAALSAATSVAADHLGLSDSGRIRPGSIADMVAVDGDPLDDICVLSDVRLVLRRGRIVDFDALAATAAEAFARPPEDPFSQLMIDFATRAAGGS
ncbi:MAG: amidohydrolase family protein [bacterium]|nr:amidohydrolase family protein [bacterium]